MAGAGDDDVAVQLCEVGVAVIGRVILSCRLGFLSLRRQLQIIAVLSAVALLGVAIPFFVFAERTTTAAHSLVDKGIVGSARVGEVEHLMLKHRAIVMRASRTWNDNQLASVPGDLLAVSQAIQAEMAGVSDEFRAGDDASPGMLKSMLPLILNNGAQVVDVALKSSGSEARRTAGVAYVEVSDVAMELISRWRERQHAITEEEVTLMFEGSNAMLSWAHGAAIAAIVIGCTGLAIGYAMLRRLWHVRDCMLRLAEQDSTGEVPYLADQDEIGSMARAIQVFKENLLRTAAQDDELRRANMRFEAALNNMSQGVCMFDASGRLDMFNQQFCALYRLDPAKLSVGMTLRELFQVQTEAGNYQGQTFEDFFQQRETVLDNQGNGVFVREINGGRLVSIARRRLPNGGVIATYEDVTDRRAAAAQIAYMARHDSLTGLPNRLVLHERIEQELTELGRGSRAALLFLDLDHFKRVNETLGHPIGDRLLRAVADRLLACVREGDTVARLGGDEFAIVQAGITRPEDAKLLAERIIATLSPSFSIDGHDILVGTSVGLALMPEDGSDTATLLKNADMALYRAKLDQRGTFCFFEAGMDARLQLRRQLELDLRSGLANDEFELYYQPLVSPATEKVVGFEALLRWHHPTRGMVSPAEFIPVAEEMGLLIPLGEWVIRTACAEAAGWPDEIKVALNLSVTQFRSRNLIPTVVLALEESGLAPDRLEFEVTETLLLQENDGTIEMLHGLRALGPRISMDDFGTGYSSLSYLRSFPFDKIKIDQSFIRDLSHREESIHIVRAIRGLCAGLGIKTTAEGVETEEQFAKVRNEGCTEAQGYLFSPPRPASEVLSIIRRVQARRREDLVTCFVAAP